MEEEEQEVEKYICLRQKDTLISGLYKILVSVSSASLHGQFV